MSRTSVHDDEQRVPRLTWLTRLPRQLIRRTPFQGDIRPRRVPLLKPFAGRPSLPFPHPWNYDEPIRILDAFFWHADDDEGSVRHNRYLDVPGFAPVLVTRDPGVIRAITTETGDRAGQFDRDTLPSTGIARATGPDTLLFSNGPLWKTQRKLAASPFGKTTLFQPEKFQEFEQTFRVTVEKRLALLREHCEITGQTDVCLQLEPEIKAVMLELLTNNFFGAELAFEAIKDTYVPALERVIDHIVRDTIFHRIGWPLRLWPSFNRRHKQAQQDAARFDELADLVLAARAEGKGLWKQFKSDAPNSALRSNIQVFLAGALEATTSYASWAITHLARHREAQQRVFQEVKDIEDYTPETLAGAQYFGHVLEETLRLTPSLYFLPRRATVDTWVTTSDGRTLMIPYGTHVLLDVWHANRHEDHWGIDVSGYPAEAFEPARWPEMLARGRESKDSLHFGFGHGPRVCPGKHLGQLEVGLVVGAFVKMFEFLAVEPALHVRAGVSTKPADGTTVKLRLRVP